MEGKIGIFWLIQKEVYGCVRGVEDALIVPNHKSYWSEILKELPQYPITTEWNVFSTGFVTHNPETQKFEVSVGFDVIKKPELIQKIKDKYQLSQSAVLLLENEYSMPYAGRIRHNTFPGVGYVLPWEYSRLARRANAKSMYITLFSKKTGRTPKIGTFRAEKEGIQVTLHTISLQELTDKELMDVDTNRECSSRGRVVYFDQKFHILYSSKFDIKRYVNEIVDRFELPPLHETSGSYFSTRLRMVPSDD